MPSAPQPPKRSWRDDTSGGRGATNKREWQKEPGKGSRGPWFTKRVKVLLAATSLLAVVVGVVVLWFIIRRPDPPRLVLIGAGYETNLAVPHNVYGKRGLSDLKEWAEEQNKNHGGDRAHSIDVHQEELTAESDPFDKALKNCTSKSVVVFVAVHGGASAAQGAYLLPNNADPRNSFASYTISKALTALEALPKDTRKLLILDTTQVSTDWNLGLLHNDFVRTLANDPRLKNIPNLIVFCASDENQRSWVSEEYGRTIFAHYVVEGLKGAAKQNDNGLLTAQELIDYVQTQVESWVRHNRGDVQTPRVIGPDNLAKDMELVTVERSAYKEPDPAQLPQFPPPDELLAAWKQRDELANAFPQPMTYTPHLWRQYHDALLRYEQLLRAVDNNAAAMAQEIGKLVSRIRQSQRLEYDALAATLSTPTALGWSLPDKDEQKLRQEFTALWDDSTAKPEAFGDMLKEWRNTVSEPSVKHLGRLRVVALLLERARRADKEADFKRVCDILPLVDDALPPRRPAEAHFALMMQNYVPDKSRDWTRMRAGLVTRLHAEQATLGLPRLADDTRLPDSFTPYSEQLRPWIDKSVETADTARRDREDLLFPSPKEAARLGAKLDDADALYGKIQGRAGEVRAALQLRDRILADLPYYSQWLARQSSLSAADEKHWLDTWDGVHELCRLLEAPDPDKIDGLKEPMKDIHFDELVETFKTAYQVNDTSDTQQNWNRLHNLLSVPLIPADIRQDLLANEARRSWELNKGTKQAEKLPGVDKQQADRNTEAAAQRQGRFALHMLGNKHPDYKVIEPIIAKPEGEWQKSLNRAGEDIGHDFNKIAVKLYDDTDQARRKPLSDAEPLLRDAALRVRLVSGAAVAAWSPRDPVGDLRNVQMCELLKWQGERTFADYWAGIDSAQPYYRDAGKMYVDAAKALACKDLPDLTDEQKSARLEDLTKLEAKLAADDKFEWRWRDGNRYQPGPAVLHITDEDGVQRSFGLVRPPNAPEGFPVVWEEIGNGLKPAEDADLDRRALDKLPKQPDDMRVEYTLKPETPRPQNFEKEKTQYLLKGFYRGRRFSLETTVTLHNQPEIVSFAPQMPPTGRIAITATKEDYERFAAENSELVIVVDYSGSMDYDNDGKLPKRITRVLTALEACLRKVPKGVKVTLLTFSDNIRGHQNEVNLQWKRVPWSPDEVQPRMDKLRKLEPYGYTPLMLATVMARDYFSADAGIAKTLVVLTDGGDNYYYSRDRDREPLNTPKRTMAECLQEKFDKKNIAVTVVGVDLKQLFVDNPNLTPTQKKELEEERKGKEEYQKAIESIGGVFLEVDKPAELAEKLEEQLLQIRYFIDEKGGRLPPETPGKPIPKDGYRISPDKENKVWIGPVTPGLFNVVIQTNRLKRKALAQLVDVRAGESLVLKLVPTPDGSGFHLRRETYADSFTIKNLNREIHRQEVPRRDVEDKTWILSVLQNQAIDKRTDTSDGVQMTVSLEERNQKPLAQDASLGMTRPYFVWFRASSPKEPTKTVPGLRFYPLAGYPAPCYRLDYLHWRVPVGETRETQMDVWWYDRPLPEGALFLRPTDKALTQAAERPVEVRPIGQNERTTVVIESITQERRAVKLQPGDNEAKEVDCLVVRLRYPVDKDPFFVQLPPGTNVGAEHRFFTAAGKYTGIFWNVSAKTADEMKSLTLYSVGGLLNSDEGYHVGPMKLGLPNKNDAPPQD